jgi:hypothetical protein
LLEALKPQAAAGDRSQGGEGRQRL